MKIAVVQGTRPEIIKNYSVVRALRAENVAFEVLHTNQHHLPSMSDEVYDALGYTPDRTLKAEYRLGTAIDWLQHCFRRDGISHVIVNGDTAAALAGALAATYLGIHVSHIEAGLRSNDPYMLEERNRIMVDAVANALFAYTRYEQELLEANPEIRGRVHFEGNTTLDVLADFAHRFEKAPLSGQYIFATMHRKEFTDSRPRMAAVFELLRNVAEQCPVVFPLHPRTLDAMNRFRLDERLLGNVTLTEPVSIFESLAYQKHAAAIVTDSGCIQEEAYILGVPCVTVRENTERHLTVANGANTITGFAPASMRAGVQWALTLRQKDWPSIYGTAGVGARIVRRIAERPCEEELAPALSFA
jgi:UDP-N-acetylglucosamine 2-epimerase (non-hydrolysing)